MIISEINFIEKYIYEEKSNRIGSIGDFEPKDDNRYNPAFYIIFKTELYNPFKKFLMSKNIKFQGQEFDRIRQNNKSSEILIKFLYSYTLISTMFNHNNLTEQLTKSFNILRIDKKSEFEQLVKFIIILENYAMDKRKVKIDYLLKLNE